MWSQATPSSSSSPPLRIILGCLIVLLNGAAPATAVFKNDFSDYPSATHSCLDNASAISGCNGDTSAAMNLCLCTNGGNFVTDSANCIAQQDSGDMESTWEVMESHCSVSNTPLSISLAQWMAQASSVSNSTTATASTATTTATVSATATPASSHSANEDTALSATAKIAIIAVSVGSGLLLLAIALFFCLRYKRRRYKYDQVQPTLLADSQHTGLLLDERVTSSYHPSHMSMGPSELESTANMGIRIPATTHLWHTPSDTSSAPWSVFAFERINSAQFVGAHQPPPLNDVHEIPADESHMPQSLMPPASPAELPTIAVTLPTNTVSPNSRYSGEDWVSEAFEEPRLHEPFRSR